MQFIFQRINSLLQASVIPSLMKGNLFQIYELMHRNKPGRVQCCWKINFESIIRFEGQMWTYVVFNAQIIINYTTLVHYCNVAEFIESIANLPKNISSILDFKSQGHWIIGFCRKSRTIVDTETISKCLQSIVLGLSKERCLAPKLYVTASCNTVIFFRKKD